MVSCPVIFIWEMYTCSINWLVMFYGIYVLYRKFPVLDLPVIVFFILYYKKHCP